VIALPFSLFAHRALAILPGVGFVSGSHDFTAKVWALSGEVVSELLGHTALIYAVAALPNGLIATGVCVCVFVRCVLLVCVTGVCFAVVKRGQAHKDNAPLIIQHYM